MNREEMLSLVFNIATVCTFESSDKRINKIKALFRQYLTSREGEEKIMSDKYCPAGKIECELLKHGLKYGPCCTAYKPSDQYCQYWEACPYESRQKPIEGKMIEMVYTDTDHLNRLTWGMNIGEDDVRFNVLGLALNAVIKAINEMRKE